MQNGKHETYLEKFKQAMKILLSSEFYDDIVLEMQRDADREKAERLERNAAAQAEQHPQHEDCYAEG